MRIYFVGAASTGKTTLARYTSQRWNLTLLPEVARMVLAEKELKIDSLRADIDLVNKYQTEIFYRQLAEEQKHKDSFVSDRSFDCLVYAANYSICLADLMETPECQEYMKGLSKPDVKIFFVRPNKETIFQDGTRESLSWDNLLVTDGMVKFLLEMHRLKYMNISTSSMQERVRILENCI